TGPPPAGDGGAPTPPTESKDPGWRSREADPKLTPPVSVPYCRSPCARIAKPVLVSESFILSAAPVGPDNTKLKSTVSPLPDAQRLPPTACVTVTLPVPVPSGFTLYVPLRLSTHGPMP